MSTTEIRKKLLNYIEKAEDRKIKALYTMVEGEIEFADPWENKTFVAEIIKRTRELESGKVKGLSFEEFRAKSNKVLKAAKSK